MVTIAGLEFFWGKKKEEPPKKVELNEFQLFCQRLAGNIGPFDLETNTEGLAIVERGEGKERVDVWIIDLDEVYFDFKVSKSEVFYPEQTAGIVPVRVEQNVLLGAMRKIEDEDDDIFDIIGERYVNSNRGKFPLVMGGEGRILILLRMIDNSVTFTYGSNYIENWEAGVFEKSSDPDVSSWIEKFRKGTMKGVKSRKHSWINQ